MPVSPFWYVSSLLNNSTINIICQKIIRYINLQEKKAVVTPWLTPVNLIGRALSGCAVYVFWF